MNGLYLLFGAVFGFLLSRVRATDYNTIVNLFRFEDFHIGGVMGVAIAAAAAGLYLLRRATQRAAIGCAIGISRKAGDRSTIAAGLVFGAGWALTGT